SVSESAHLVGRTFRGIACILTQRILEHCHQPANKLRDTVRSSGSFSMGSIGWREGGRLARGRRDGLSPLPSLHAMERRDRRSRQDRGRQRRSVQKWCDGAVLSFEFLYGAIVMANAFNRVKN